MATPKAQVRLLGVANLGASTMATVCRKNSMIHEKILVVGDETLLPVSSYIF